MPRRESIEWVVIEEVEAGLYPAAISVVLLIVIELLSRGYKVCLSTHSPHVLDVVWAVQTLKTVSASSDRILEFFEAPKTPQMRKVAEELLQKDLRVYHFDGLNGRSKDISSLDPSSPDAIEANWGKLTEYSGRMADIIAEVISEHTE